MPWLLVACFFLSGATSLVLQVVWVRQLIDVFGSSSLAISTVLATFMGGLALGAWLGGVLADRLQRAKRRLLSDPFIFYAFCEGMIAISALLIPIIVGNYRGANAWLWGQLGDSPVALALARFGLAAIVLLPPTTCMGATLPLLGRRVTRSRDDLGALGRRIGVLYAANTTGAVCGAAAAGFLMIRHLGVRTTNTVAATVAGCLAITIVVVLVALARSATEAAAPARPPPAEKPPKPLDLSLTDRRLAVFAFAVSGAVAMSLEVLWSRALGLVLGSSVYSFTLVLVVFLIGIAAGAAIVARFAATTRDPLGILAWLFAGVAVSIMVMHQITDELPVLFLAMLANIDLEVGTILGLHTALIGLLILPTSLCLGAIMPIVVRAYARDLDAVGRDVGRAYACNTVGAIVGAFAGGFIVLPYVGMENGVRGAAIIDIALACLMAWRAAFRHRRAVYLLAASVLAGVLVLPQWNKSRLTAGVFRGEVARRYIKAGQIFEHPVVFHADGIATTVTVEMRRGKPILKNNGKVDASAEQDVPTQILAGLLPVLLHPGSEQDVFVVGYGSGITVGSVAVAPEVRRVDVVELEPEVYRAADKFFGPYNNLAHENPRVHRYVGDGRNFLLAGDRTYDIIVSEPPNPWVAGVASLFTREFYSFARDHLAEDGLFCQWAQLYELRLANVKVIYNTFHEAFPYVYAFTATSHSSDTLLIGSRHPIDLDLEHLHQRARVPAIARELERARVSTPEVLLANLILAPSEVAGFAGDAPINTDDNAYLEYSAPRDLLADLSRREGEGGRHAIHSEDWPYGDLEGIVSGLGTGETRAERTAVLSQALLRSGRRRSAVKWLEVARAAGAPSDQVELLDILARLVGARPGGDAELVLTAGGPPLPEPSASLFRTPDAATAEAAASALGRGQEHVAAERWAEAWAELRRLPSRQKTDAGRDVSLLTAFVAYKAGKHLSAERHLSPLVSDEAYSRQRPAAVYYAGCAAWSAGNFEFGVDHLARFAALAPEAARALAGLPPRPDPEADQPSSSEVESGSNSPK